jgi:hypothetical protein
VATQFDLPIALGITTVAAAPITTISSPGVALVSGIALGIGKLLDPRVLASLVTSKTVHFCHFADAGFVESGGAGTGVSQWTDLVASGTRHATASGTAKPTATAGGGPGGKGYCLTFNGTSHGMNTALAVTPGTVPFFRRTLARVLSGFTNAGQLTCGSTTNRLGIRSLTGPTAQSGNSTNSSAVSIATGTWYLFDEFYNNSADFLRIGNLAATTPTALGNTAAGSLGLGARADAGAAWLKCETVFHFGSNGLLTNAELNAQAAILQDWYGAANIVVPTYP